MEALPKEDMEELLREARICHLGLCHEERAYVLPLFYGYDGENFYFHSHPGMKDGFIEDTEEACLVVTTVLAPDDWSSVQVFGKVERISLMDEVHNAESALLDVPLPPEWGETSSGKPMRSDQQLYYWKLKPTRMSGRRSVYLAREA